MVYRIYTENKNYDSLVTLTNALFPAFTITRGIGVWEGKAEQSAVIEIAEVGRDNGTLENRVLTLAENIRSENEQDAVLVVSIPATGILLTRHDAPPRAIAETIASLERGEGSKYHVG